MVWVCSPSPRDWVGRAGGVPATGDQLRENGRRWLSCHEPSGMRCSGRGTREHTSALREPSVLGLRLAGTRRKGRAFVTWVIEGEQEVAVKSELCCSERGWGGSGWCGCSYRQGGGVFIESPRRVCSGHGEKAEVSMGIDAVRAWPCRWVPASDRTPWGWGGMRYHGQEERSHGRTRRSNCHG